MSKTPGICILAAGKGTRMKSSLPKVLQPVAGGPLIEYVLEAVGGLAGSATAPVVLVVGHQHELVQRSVTDILIGAPAGSPLAQLKPQFVVQEPQLGTGHAVQIAASAFQQLANDGGELFVLLGDVPLITTATLDRLLAHHREMFAAATMLTMEVPDPTGYGRVLRDGQGMVEGVVEHKDASDGQRRIREVNTGIFVFNARALLEALPALSSENASGEFYLPDVIPVLLRAGRKCAALMAADPMEVQGVNSFRQLAVVDRAIRDRIIGKLMDSGVYIMDPATTWIDKGVEIGPDTTILPHVVIRRGVKIGSHCEVGPFAHLRVGTLLHDTAEIGNFVEAKKAEIGPHTKAKHLTYLGDVTIGENTNVGAGTIICNYDGQKKHHTVIGSHCFIGSGSMIVAPRTIADRGRTGAGSVVTKDVAEGVTVAGIGTAAKPLRGKFKS
ncbi:MAG: bifunctional N-acetylglucosamine-1-phosphate uridyltransferase/glucosamine-1-phosphate acetyltransferase [Planctomycetota bacterium]